MIEIFEAAHRGEVDRIRHFVEAGGNVNERDHRSIMGNENTLLHVAADGVSVRVVGRVERADVAGVAEQVAVRVGLGRVRDRRAVVDVAADPVSVGFLRRVERARVASITESVAVGVGLIRVRDRRA